MSRPKLEVADIFRRHGAAWRRRAAEKREERAALHSISLMRHIGMLVPERQIPAYRTGIITCS
jgi:hypothetical protein